MKQVTASQMDTYNIQLAFKASFRAWTHRHRYADEVAIVLQPFGDELFKVVQRGSPNRLER